MSQQQSNQQSSPIEKGTEMQKRTIEQSQEALEQAFTFPLEQGLELQRNGMQMAMNALDVQTSMQRQGIDLVKSAMTTFMDTLESSGTAVERSVTSSGSMSGQQQPPQQQPSQQPSQQPPRQATAQQRAPQRQAQPQTQGGGSQFYATAQSPTGGSQSGQQQGGIAGSQGTGGQQRQQPEYGGSLQFGTQPSQQSMGQQQPPQGTFGQRQPPEYQQPSFTQQQPPQEAFGQQYAPTGDQQMGGREAATQPPTERGAGGAEQSRTRTERETTPGNEASEE